MKPSFRFITVILLLLIGTAGTAYWRVGGVGEDVTGKATAFVGTLTDEQKAIAVLAFDKPERFDWHFIPKEYRKGLQLKEMNEPQRKAAHALLQATLSEIGYGKATSIMQLEHILYVLEHERNSNKWARETDRYYFTIFGTPSEKGDWGLSIEGHHLSLNFTVKDGEITSSTPTFFASNPSTVMNEVEGGLPKGTRVLKKEEQLAFDLLNSLSPEQKAAAVIADTAPSEIRAAGEPQPPTDEKVGIKFTDLDEAQQGTMKKLVGSYAENMPKEIRDARIDAIVKAGPENVRFAWAGASKPGIGHYYRIQGPTFLIEFVNTQPDPAGNPANHIHCVWRDMKGDFSIPIE
ncbi:MAG: DUF3500 domain-containing protein [Planctomycetaceae bacterium]|nr:DUF3500 domain-containing protein [Planctomycetales bacterium]MCB9923774.1 DUF3500 domain-containing protein [Planctomycetaceae bacterium]